MLRPLAPLDRVAFSELLDLCLAERPDPRWKANGSFTKQTRNDSGEYWYFRGYEKSVSGRAGRQTLTYAGKVGDPELEVIVATHRDASRSYRNRRQLASKLRRAGLPSPHPLEGAMVEALASAGLFARGTTMVGSIAFQTYGGLLGVRLDEQSYRTQNMDVAEPRGLIAGTTDVPCGDLLDALIDVDPTFRALHHGSEPTLVAGFGNQTGLRIDFLTPQSDRGGATRMRAMKAVPGVAAQQLRFLEFVLEDPVHSVILHDAGIAVPVPEPSRYAVHKLIVAAMRTAPGLAGQNRSKALKDILQAQSLIDAAAHARLPAGLGLVWMEAWGRGPAWRRALREGTLRLSPENLSALAEGVREAGALDGFETPFDRDDDPRTALLGIGERRR